MKVQLTQEHIDRAIASISPTRDNVCKCCPIWQALRPIIGHDNFTVGFTVVWELGAGTRGDLSEAAWKITEALVSKWPELKPTEFEYTPRVNAA